MSSLSFVVGLTLTLFSATPRAANDGWELLKQDDAERTGWALYHRAKAGSDFEEYKVMGFIDAEPTKALRAFREAIFDEKHRSDAQEVTILESSAQRVLTHGRAKMPAFFADRDVVLEYEFFEKTGLGTVGVSWRDGSARGPKPTEGVVRISQVSGGWEFAPADAGRTLATCVTHVDLGGSIPAWMVNRLMGDHLVQDLEKIRGIAGAL